MKRRTYVRCPGCQEHKLLGEDGQISLHNRVVGPFRAERCPGPEQALVAGMRAVLTTLMIVAALRGLGVANQTD